MIEKWSTHRVPHGELPGGLHKEAAVLEGPHGVRPCFTARINEATVDPARHFVYLQPHVFRATFHHLFPNVSTIFSIKEDPLFVTRTRRNSASRETR